MGRGGEGGVCGGGSTPFCWGFGGRRGGETPGPPPGWKRRGNEKLGRLDVRRVLRPCPRRSPRRVPKAGGGGHDTGRDGDGVMSLSSAPRFLRQPCPATGSPCSAPPGGSPEI